MKNLVAVLFATAFLVATLLGAERLDPGVTERSRLPSWLRVGTFVVYGTQSSAATKNSGEFDAATTLGYLLYLVTNIQDGRVFGIEFQYDRDVATGLYSSRWELRELGELESFLFFSPELFGEGPSESSRGIFDVSTANVTIGPSGDVSSFSVQFSEGGEEFAASYFYTSDWVITKATYSRRSDTEAESVVISLIGIYELELPALSVPEVAKKNVTYSMLYGPFGDYFATAFVRSSFVRLDGDIATYSLRGSGFYSGRSTALGNQLISRFYINPELLKLKEIFSLPDVGFSMRVTGFSRSGGLLVTLFIENEPVEVNEYDPKTGLLLNSQSWDMDLIFLKRLVTR